MIMTKIEQGRIEWDADFMSLADDFIDKKVRLGLRSRYTPAASNSSSKPSYYGRGTIGKGFRSQGQSGQRYGAGRGNSGKPLYGAVCWQWNNGTCTYGENCKRWHVCRTCADAGKLGEQHKASACGNSGSKPKPSV